MQTKQITCIRCPLGCQIQVDIAGKEVMSTRNNLCARGKQYAQDEVLRPTRMVTSLIPIKGQIKPLSVKTALPIPKDAMQNVLDAIRNATPVLPIAIGDVILHDVCGTGVDVVATCTLG